MTAIATTTTSTTTMKKKQVVRSNCYRYSYLYNDDQDRNYLVVRSIPLHLLFMLAVVVAVVVVLNVSLLTTMDMTMTILQVSPTSSSAKDHHHHQNHHRRLFHHHNFDLHSTTAISHHQPVGTTAGSFIVGSSSSVVGGGTGGGSSAVVAVEAFEVSSTPFSFYNRIRRCGYNGRNNKNNNESLDGVVPRRRRQSSRGGGLGGRDCRGGSVLLTAAGATITEGSTTALIAAASAGPTFATSPPPPPQPFVQFLPTPRPGRRRYRQGTTTSLSLSKTTTSTSTSTTEGFIDENSTDVVSSQSNNKKLNEHSKKQKTLSSNAHQRRQRRPLTEKQKQAWLQKFEEMKQYQDENNGSSYPPDGTPLRNWADVQRTQFNKEQMYSYRIELLNSINFQWSKPKSGRKLNWGNMYERLVEYKERFCHTKVPTNYPKDPQLGKWCYNQKVAFHKGKLDPEKKSKLDSIGFVFDNYVPNDDRWDAQYDRLVAYWKKHNSTLVPATYKDDPELAAWVNKQRLYYNKNDSRMTPERIERLEAIGFVWVVQEAAWQEMYNRLVDYWKKHNSTLVPAVYEDDPDLGVWVSNQRRSYNKNATRMTPERIERLEAIGFVWDAQEAAWDDKYNRLVEYWKKHNSTLVPAVYEDDQDLGVWVSNQRHYYNKNATRMTPERIERLEAIGFVWSVDESKGEKDKIQNNL